MKNLLTELRASFGFNNRMAMNTFRLRRRYVQIYNMVSERSMYYFSFRNLYCTYIYIDLNPLLTARELELESRAELVKRLLCRGDTGRTGRLYSSRPLSVIDRLWTLVAYQLFALFNLTCCNADDT